MGVATPQLSAGVAPPTSIPPVGLAPPTINLGVQPPEPGYSMPTAVSATMTTDQPPPTKEDNTIGAQENLKISGRDARHMVMQKLMRQTDEVSLVVVSEHICDHVGTSYMTGYCK